VLGAQGEDDGRLGDSSAFNWELGDQPIFVFEFHVQVLIPDDGGSAINDLCKFSGWKSVIRILGHPSLEGEVGDFTNGGTAIQKGLVDPSHLGDVGVNRNSATIWKDELKMMLGMGNEEFQECRGIHEFEGSADLIATRLLR
jgi:hypothetical protein